LPTIADHRIIHAQLLISRPGGAWEDVSDHLISASCELGNVDAVGTEASGVDGVVRTLEFALANDGVAGEPDRGSFSPRDQDSPWNQWGAEYSPLLWPGREVILRVGVEADQESGSTTVIGEQVAVADGSEVAFSLDRSPVVPSSVRVYVDNTEVPRSAYVADDDGTVVFDAPPPPLATITATYTWLRTEFRGVLGQRIRTDGGTVSCEASDLARRLQYTYIYEPAAYGSEAGVPVELVMQQIIDDHMGDDAPLLHVAEPTGAVVSSVPEPWVVEYMSVWDAIQTAATQIGWFLGYRYSEAHNDFVLTLMEPPVDKGIPTADYHLTWTSDIITEDLDIVDEHIRNLVTVYYRDFEGNRLAVTVPDEDSRAEFGTRSMTIEEPNADLIRTETAANRLANAALDSLAQLYAETHLDLPYLPGLDVFDGIVVTNPRVSSTDDFFACQSVRFDLDWSTDVPRFRSEAIAAGRVVRGRQRYLDKETRPGSPGRPIDREDLQHLDEIKYVPYEINHVNEMTTRFDTIGAFLRDADDTENLYAARIAFGTASDGDFIPLGWDHEPKVIAAPFSAMTYIEANKDVDQKMVTTVTNVSPEGFTVNVRTMALGAEQDHAVGQRLGSPNQQWTSSSSAPGVQEIELNLRLEKNADMFARASCVITQTYRIEYREENETEWSLFGEFSDRAGLVNTNYLVRRVIYNRRNRTHILTLPAGSYRIRVTFVSRSISNRVSTIYGWDAFMDVQSWGYKTDELLTGGDVLWFAVEGGAEDTGAEDDN